jgi:hypothetical protein
VLDTSTKLTYDVKQEITIDPVATGLGPDDEMALSSIASRESYLTQFPWSTSDVPETLLWNCYVEPMLYDTATPGASTEYHYTPMAYAALPFENWRGTIKYRFQIVASAFHKGRLKIVYEPYFNLAGASEYNTQYTHVIDLAKERDFTVDVQWGQEYSYLDHRDLGFVGTPFSTSVLGGALHGQANGIIGIYVVNDLTTPSATLDDVTVLVSVSAGDDFEVVNPNTNVEDVTFWQPQSVLEEQSADMEVADADFTTEETAPVSSNTETNLAIDINMQNNAQKIYFGDPVTSIRQILKRYYYYRPYVTTQTFSTLGRALWNLPDFPMYRGYATGTLAAIDNAATPVDPTPYNFGATTLINWFTPAFLCRRGGLRHKYIFYSTDETDGIMYVARFAEPLGYSKSAGDVVNATSPSLAISNAQNAVPYFSSGGVHTTQTNFNPTLEVELPFFTNYRFFPARTLNFNSTTSEFNKFHSLAYPIGSTAAATHVQDFVSVGEDFSLSFFQAVPRFFVMPTKVASATN